MSINDIIRDRQVRHHVGIQRLSRGVLRTLIGILDRADLDLVEQLVSRGPTLEGSFTSKRLQYLLDTVREINREAWLAAGAELRKELRGLVRYEVGFQQRLFASLPVRFDLIAPSVEQLIAITTSKPLGGKLLKEMIADVSLAKRNRISEAIRQGMVQGETASKIVQRIRGTQARNYRDGVLEISRQSAAKLVNTSVNSVSNSAREELFAANADIVNGVQWIATLDTRTCLRCGSLDGQLFKLDRGPRPPLHINCRCTITPALKSWKSMGLNIAELPPVERASMNGMVSGSETFNGWLKKQPAAVQDEALGPTRGALFRRGNLSVDRFLDIRGNQLTLDELRDLEGRAFDRAGIAA